MGKGGGGTNTVVSNQAPPAQVMAQYQNVIDQANQVASTPYTTGGFNVNNMIAPFSGAQNAAFNTINQAQELQAPYLNNAQAYLNNSQAPIWNNVQQYNPSTMAQYANPYLNQAVGATRANIEESNAEQQQQVMGNAISSGAWGGDRSAIAQSELARQQALAENQTISGMENTGFNQQQGEFNAQQQAQIGANEANAWLGTQGSAIESNLGNTALNDTLQGASTQLQAGALQQQLQQEQMNIPYQQFQAQFAYPFQNTGWLSNISTGVGGSMGGTSSTTSPGPSTLGQVGGLGLSGLSLAGASGGFTPQSGWLTGSQGGIFGSGTPAAKRGGGIHFARGGLARGNSMPRHFADGGSGGEIPGFLPVSTFENPGIPDPSSNRVMSNVNPQGGMGLPKPAGTTSTTTGAPTGGGFTPANAATIGNAVKGISGMLSGPAAGSVGATVANANKAGLGDMVQGFQLPGGGANTISYVNAAGDSVQPGMAGMDAAALPWQTGSASSLPWLSGAGTGASAAGDAAATAGATAGADAAMTDAAITAATTAAAAETAALPEEAAMAAVMFAHSGGRVPRGLRPHYDDGGAIGGFTPSVTGSNPFVQNQYSQYQSMPPEKLQEMAAMYGNSPRGQMIRQALQQKQMMGMNTAAQSAPAAAAAPQVNQAQPAMARGGSPRHYDAGGSDDSDYLTQITGGPQLSPRGLSPAPQPVNDNTPRGLAPAAPSDIPDHDTWMKNYTDKAASAEPYNKVDPWLALGAAGAGMLASRSPYAGVALGEGMQEGLKNYGEQKKEAAAESERRGTLQEQGEQLYNNLISHKEQMAHENEQLQETGRHNTAEEGLKGKEIANTAQNQLWERQKPIPDGFGGFIVPNPADPAHPTQINLGGTGGDSSKVSLANIYNPPKDANGEPLHGKDFLSTIPPSIGSQAMMYALGDAPPPTGFASKPALLAAHEAAKGVDPTYVGTRFSTIHDYTTSNTQANQTMRSQNATMEHMGVLQDAMTSLNNGDVRAFNSLANQLAKQSGVPAPTNYEEAKTIVADEMAKAIIGGRATQGDRQEFAKNLDMSAGREQLQGQIDTASKLMAGQAHTVEQNYNSGTGLDPNKTPQEIYSHLNYRDKFMLPNARKLLEKYYPSDKPGQQGQSAAPTPTITMDQVNTTAKQYNKTPEQVIKDAKEKGFNVAPQ